MEQNHAILIVDDDPRISRLLQRYLEEEGYRIYTASSRKEMGEKLARSRVNLVLLDVRLPDDDGFTLVKGLRALSNVAVIMVSCWLPSSSIPSVSCHAIQFSSCYQVAIGRRSIAVSMYSSASCARNLGMTHNIRN